MLRRVISIKLPGDVFFNVHIRTHYYAHMGLKINFEKIPLLFFGAGTIYSFDVHFYILFLDVLVNINKALGVEEMKKIIMTWKMPNGREFSVEWKVTDKGKFWRIEGSNGEFFPISKEEAPKFNDVVEILKHIYDEDVKKEWEKIEGGGVDD